jgi:alpha-acetolactate decarboxylase
LRLSDDEFDHLLLGFLEGKYFAVEELDNFGEEGIGVETMVEGRLVVLGVQLVVLQETGQALPLSLDVLADEVVEGFLFF